MPNQSLERTPFGWPICMGVPCMVSLSSSRWADTLTFMHKIHLTIYSLFLVSGAFMLTGCGSIISGTMRTDYSFTSPLSEKQKKQITQIVETTAGSLNLKKQSGIGYDNQYGSSTYRKRSYFESDSIHFDSLAIQTEKFAQYVSISEGGNHKSKKFILVEDAFTQAFREIDPNITIKSGCYVNPMM